MGEAGLEAVPFLSWDGLYDGSGTDDGSFLQQVGVAAAGTYVAHASLAPSKASFVDAYRSTYRMVPDEYTGAYAGAAYACVEVIVAALRAIAASGPSADGLRDALRAYAVDPTHRYETVLGTIGFDANGDSIQQFVTFYRADASADGGAGDWVIEKQQDFGPAR
jgi:ABC-type branched-subunit amino acid transport system substrate-binding protein